MIMMVLLLALVLLLFPSCPMDAYEFEKVPSPSPFTLPQLEEAILIDNERVSLSFDRPVVFRDLSIDHEEVRYSFREDRMFIISLPEAIRYGETRRLRFTVEDKASGNMARLSIPLMGINREQARVLMTEISVKGTETSPDRIELYVLESGTTGALTITDGSLDTCSFRTTLPDFRVSRGDIIVLHLSMPHRGEDVMRVGNHRVFNVDSDERISLLSTNGAVVLYAHTNGKGRILDSFIYTKSDATASEGYGNEKTRITAEELKRRNHWSGPGFTSDGNTSTRVFARSFPYEDSNTMDDWYLTATRGATFGQLNDNNAFLKPEE